MKNLTTCFDSSRSRSCYDRCELISVHISRGLKQNVSIMSSFIRPMLWLLWTNHEVWCKSYQSWVVLLLMSIKVININTLFLREHMCNKFQKYVKQALAWHCVVVVTSQELRNKWLIIATLRRQINLSGTVHILDVR